MSPDITHLSQASGSENESLLHETMDISEQGRTRSQYDSAYWKRAMKTGCIFMVFISVVSLFGHISTSEFDDDNISFFRESLRV